MNRRLELKLEKIRIFSRKYIFSSRFIVRNTVAVVGIVSVIGTSAVSANVLGEKFSAVKQAAVEKAVEAKVEAKAEEAGSNSSLYENSFVNVSSISTKESETDADEDVELEKNKISSLTSSKYDMTGKFIAIGYGVNIRESAGTDAEPVGVLPMGATGKVLGTDGDWTEISSGTVKGYVKSEFLATDEKATAIAEDSETSIATVDADSVAVRKEADKASDIIYLADNGDEFPVVKDKKIENDNSSVSDDLEDETSTDTKASSDGEYSKIELPDGTTAFVSSEYLKMEDGFKTAVSMSDIDDFSDKKAEYAEGVSEKNSNQQVNKNTAFSTSKTSGHAVISVPKSSDTPDTNASDVSSNASASTSDENLLAALVYAESGNQPYAGQLAVANIVINRLKSGKYGSTISDVIYSPNQFDGIYSPYFQSSISNPNPTSLQAVREALSGNNNVPGLMSFRPTWYGSYSGVQIGDQIFF